MIFAYISDFFNSKKVFPLFEDEYNLMKKNFQTLLINENIEQLKTIHVKEPVIYRGWMLTPENYKELASKIVFEDGTSALYTSPEMYVASHHLPEWYPYIESNTCKSYITTEEDAVNCFKSNNLQSAFVKDYVKSLKTNFGSIAKNTEELTHIISLMKNYRGHIEGGIVLREVHDFITDTEKRFFILKNEIFSPTGTTSDIEYNLLIDVISKLPYRNFYCIDTIKSTDGNTYVVEIGDGQVSDYVGWDLVKFTNIFIDTFKQKTL